MDGGARECAPEVVLVGDLAHGDDGVGDGSADVGSHNDGDSLWDGEHWNQSACVKFDSDFLVLTFGYIHNW